MTLHAVNGFTGEQTVKFILNIYMWKIKFGSHQLSMQATINNNGLSMYFDHYTTFIN